MRCKANERGAILIVTLWTLLILSVLAAGMAFRLSMEARLARYFLDEYQAESLAKAGIFRAVEGFSKGSGDVDTLYQCGLTLKTGEKPEDFFQNIPLGDGSFNVGYKEDGTTFTGVSDEDRKINLNTAGESVLTALFITLGGVTDQFLARQISYNVIDWRDADHASSMQEGAEDDYYQSLPNPYHCADRPFRTVEELLLVKDVTPEIFQKIRKYVTVYGDDTTFRLNLNTVSESVLRVIGVSIGMEDENAKRLAQRIAAWRAGPDQKPGTQDDGFFTNADIAVLETRLPDLSVLTQANLIPAFKNFFKSDSSYYRIESTGKITASSVQKTLVAVVKKTLDDKGRPLFVYYHQD